MCCFSLRHRAMVFQAAALRSRHRYLPHVGAKTSPHPAEAFYQSRTGLYSLPGIQHFAPKPPVERRLRGAEPFLYGDMASLLLEAVRTPQLIFFSLRWERCKCYGQ